MSRILIADDNEQNRYMLESALKGCGYEVTSAANGREALDLARKDPPDIIITDILMPVMDGYELCRKWKSDERLKAVPFVFYTATYTDPKDEAFGMSLGADRFIVKPAKIEELQKVVKEFLQAGPHGRLSAPPEGVAEEEVLREYNEVIFRKLQHKVEQLETEVDARRKTEQALAAAARELEEKNRELNDFLYISSHDLRSPMVRIQGFSENIGRYCSEISSLIKQKDGDKGRLEALLQEKMPEALRFVSSGIADMDRLLSGLLRMSRLWSMPIARQEVDMGRLVGELLQSMYFQLKEAGAEVSYEDLPACAADPTQIKQVFFTLVDNAVKYRDPSRKPKIVISGKATGNGAVIYTVADNGRGIPRGTEREKIWELFYRGNPKDPVPGEGVGLTIAKRILEKHGGTIEAAEAPGGGTAFTVRLPAVND